MGKAILVTGASRGIGAATARLGGSRGWSVGINYVNDEAAARKVREDIGAAGGAAMTVRGDVAIEGDVVGMFDAAERVFGRLDGVVLNAAIGARSMSLADMDAGRLRRMVDVNVYGAFLCAREAARRMSRSKGGNGGSIVIISSGAVKRGSPNDWVDYAATKGAMDALTTGLSKELAPEGVRVNAVRPGLIATDFHDQSGRPDRLESFIPHVPLGRAGTPDEVAEAIIWLVSDAASYVNGAHLDVGGGL